MYLFLKGEIFRWNSKQRDTLDLDGFPIAKEAGERRVQTEKGKIRQITEGVGSIRQAKQYRKMYVC